MPGALSNSTSSLLTFYLSRFRDQVLQTQAIGLALSSSHSNSNPTVGNQHSTSLGIPLGDREMSGNKTSCQTSLFSILISFFTNESYLLTKYHLSCPMCIRISQEKEDGVCLEKLFFYYRNSRIWRDMTYSETIFFHFFYFLSQSTIPIVRKRGIKDILQKKRLTFNFYFFCGLQTTRFF